MKVSPLDYMFYRCLKEYIIDTTPKLYFCILNLSHTCGIDIPYMWHRLMYQLKVINYIMNLSGKQSINNQINGTEERLEIDNLLIFLKEIVQCNRENKVLFFKFMVLKNGYPMGKKLLITHSTYKNELNMYCSPNHNRQNHKVCKRKYELS